MERALPLDPANARVRDNLIGILTEQGRWEDVKRVTALTGHQQPNSREV